MTKRPPESRFFLDNLGWLAGSLVLAVVIWYAAVSGQNPVEERRFPERLLIERRIDPGLMVVNSVPEVAQVTIRALQSTWNELETENISVVADLTNRGPGTYTIELKGSLNGVRGGTVVDVQPRRITVEIARRDEKRVNVTVQPAQEPPVGYLIVSTTPEQTTVLVSGPEGRVQQVEAALARVNVQGQRAGFTRTVTLIAVDADSKPVPGVALTPADMSVSVDIQQRPDVTQLAVELNFINNPPTGYFRSGFNWSPRRIFVRGSQVEISKLNGKILTEPIDLTGRTQSFTQVVKLALPPGVVMPDPTDVTVTVEIKPTTTTREFTDIPVQPQGLDPADYMITIRPERVTVIVTGPQVVVDQLTADDISIFAPLSGLAAGVHTVRLQASVAKAEIDAQSVTIPVDQVEVSITARNPTPTPTQGPTRTPTPTPTETPTPTPTPG